MNINVTISAAPDLLQILQAFVRSLSGQAVATRQEKPAKPVDAPKIVADKTVSLTQIRELATELSQAQGKGAAVKGLLKKYNCDTLTKLPQDQFETFFTELKGL